MAAAWCVALTAIVVATIALVHAARWYGHPFAGVLITTDADVSSIGMPTWGGIQQGLRFPDHFESVDGVAVVSRQGDYAARVFDRVVDEAAARGQSAIKARVFTGAGPRNVTLSIGHLDAASWWLYAGTTIFTGCLYALAAVVALGSTPGGGRGLAGTFAKFASLAALYLLTFFDAHTTRTMVVLSHVAFAWGPFALTGLALRLPDDVPLLERRPWILRLLDAAGVTTACVILVRDAAGTNVSALNATCTLFFGGAMIAFVLVLGVRLARATGRRRATLRVLFGATATPYALVGGGALLGLLSARGSTAAFFAIPALGLAPVATGVAFVRHDLWGSRALISRVAARSIASAVACAVAVGVGAAFAASVGVPFRGALVAAAAGALVSAPFVVFASKAVERRLFPAAAVYKPTIAQLSEELTSITAPRAVAEAVERTVRRWLPCDHVAFRAIGPAGGGESRSAEATPSVSDELSIGACFGSQSLGSLVVGRKRGGALFTTDDIDLLNTIANQAALALAHAHSYAELETRRQQQAAAWQTERLALVETVAAEIAHEVRYPINYFRSVFRRDPKQTKLDAEAIDIGCEEVDRLERLVAGLRRLVSHRIDRRIVPVGDLAARAELLLRDALAGRTIDVDVARGAAIRCDPDQATQVLVNLVANAIEASGPRGRLGVRWSPDSAGAKLVVWDDGPGFEGDASQLFAPWFTTKPRGTGLGLAITQRIVRAHGWTIDALREGGRTSFLVSIPAPDLASTERHSLDCEGPGARAHGEAADESPDRR